MKEKIIERLENLIKNIKAGTIADEQVVAELEDVEALIESETF